MTEFLCLVRHQTTSGRSSSLQWRNEGFAFFKYCLFKSEQSGTKCFRFFMTTFYKQKDQKACELLFCFYAKKAINVFLCRNFFSPHTFRSSAWISTLKSPLGVLKSQLNTRVKNQNNWQPEMRGFFFIWQKACTFQVAYRSEPASSKMTGILWSLLFIGIFAIVCSGM